MMVLSNKICGPPFCFQNGCHISKMSTLSDCNENWYLGVLRCDEHDGNIWKFNSKPPFFIFFCKMAAILRNINFVGFQWKFRSWGNFMWRTWWCYRNCYRSHHFLVPHILLTMAYCYAVAARWAIQAPGSLLFYVFMYNYFSVFSSTLDFLFYFPVPWILLFYFSVPWILLFISQ